MVVQGWERRTCPTVATTSPSTAHSLLEKANLVAAYLLTHMNGQSTSFDCPSSIHY